MKERFFELVLLFMFLFILIFTLGDYGMDSDSPFHFLRGQTYLDFLLTGKKIINQSQLPSPVLFVPGQRISFYNMNAWEENTNVIRKVGDTLGGTLQQIFVRYQERMGRVSFYKHKAWDMTYFNSDVGHPPISDILSAATNRIFYEKWGLLGDIEAYHLFVVFTAVLSLVTTYFFTKKNFGELPAFLAILTLGFYPFFFAESHFNIKDIPEMAFITGSIITFYFWVINRRNIFFLAFSLLFFLGLGTKFNIIFIPFIILPWLWTIRKTALFTSWFKWRLVIYFVIFLLINISLFYLLWPFLREKSLEKLLATVIYYKEVGSVDLTVKKMLPFSLPFGVNVLSLVLFITTTPLLTLTFFVNGLIATIRSNNKVRILLWAWIAVPLLRVIILSADIFGSPRQFIEFLPPLSILAGLGAYDFIVKLSSYLKINLRFVYAIVSLLYLIYLLWINFILHPNQNVYANVLIGGTNGAVKKGVFNWRTTFSNPYRQAVNWLNTNSERNAHLAYLDGTMTAISPLWLRSDISFGSYFSALEKEGEYIISLVYPDPPMVFPYLYLDRFLEPVHEIKTNEVTLVKIWKNDKIYLKREYQNIVSLNKNFTPVKGSDQKGDFWAVDLQDEYQIVKLRLKVPSNNCQKRDGLFYFNDYFIPYRIDLENNLSDFYFPAQKSRFIRFYGIVPNTCLFNAEIATIDVIAD